MRNVVLISCVSRKLDKKAKAEDLYISDLFKKNLAYSKILKPDEIYVLSAKYGLLQSQETIKPYDVTLNRMSVKEKKEWASRVLSQLKSLEDIEKTNFIFLAGNNYRKYLLPSIKHYHVPMEGMKIGQQLQYLKEKISMNNPCSEIHHIFQKMRRFKFPLDENSIPKNGIYILFENSEHGHGQDRIVRVGTHTGQNQLRSRLKQHFVKEVKDRSIFRKNIGRALLNKENDDFIQQWEWDLTTRAKREELFPLLDIEKQKKIEHEVSNYIQNNLSFVIFEVQEKHERLFLESRIISTVSHCKDCYASESWLGNFSPKSKISESGLWLVNELYKTPLEQKDIRRIKYLCQFKG